jgi:hypothetical protein
MIATDVEIKRKGYGILSKNLGNVAAERFLALVQREPFDYTQWRKDIGEDTSVRELSAVAMRYVKKKLPVGTKKKPIKRKAPGTGIA